jgi:hypothetical protein
VALCVVVAVPSVAAQETREQVLAARRAEKATRLRPYVPPVAERRLVVAQELVKPRTVTTFVGTVFPGSLLAAGPRYRRRFGGDGRFDAHAAWSLKNYKAIETSLSVPSFADGRVRIDLRASWLDAPDVAFYGIGSGSRVDDVSSFLYRATTAGGSARIQTTAVTALGGGLDYLAFLSGPGTNGPSIDAAFGPAAAPGLGARPDYTRSRLFAEVDWRQSPGYTRSGGFYRVDWSAYRQTSNDGYSFRRTDAEVAQHLPILGDTWVMAFRGLVSAIDTDAADTVPYFLLPALGGNTALRGYPTWRFRDRNRILLTGEYRWMAGPFIDMALFVDAGKVTPRARDLDLRDLKKSYGIGVRLHTATETVVRVELARTSTEGTGLLLSFSQIF